MEYFILGFLFATIGAQLLEGIQALFIGVTELLTGKLNVKIMKCNLEVAKLQEEIQQNEYPVHAVGFQIPISEEGGEDYYDE